MLNSFHKIKILENICYELLLMRIFYEMNFCSFTQLQKHSINEDFLNLQCFGRAILKENWKL